MYGLQADGSWHGIHAEIDAETVRAIVGCESPEELDELFLLWNPPLIDPSPDEWCSWCEGGEEWGNAVPAILEAAT